MTFFKIIVSAIKIILAKWTYRVALVVLSILLVTLYISVPVITIPGNTFIFQLSLYTPTDFVLFVLLSITTSLLILLQVFIFSRLRKEKQNSKVIAQGGVGIFSGLLAGVVTSVTCVPCAIGFLGIFGSVGTILIVSEYQSYFATAAIILVLLGIYYTSLRVMGYCKTCNIVE